MIFLKYFQTPYVVPFLLNSWSNLPNSGRVTLLFFTCIEFFRWQSQKMMNKYSYTHAALLLAPSLVLLSSDWSTGTVDDISLNSTSHLHHLVAFRFSRISFQIRSNHGENTVSKCEDWQSDVSLCRSSIVHRDFGLVHLAIRFSLLRSQLWKCRKKHTFKSLVKIFISRMPPERRLHSVFSTQNW